MSFRPCKHGHHAAVLGWVADHIVRENTVHRLIFFYFRGRRIWALRAFGNDPVLFVLLSGWLCNFAWGESLQHVPIDMHRRGLPAPVTPPPMHGCSTRRRKGKD